MSELVWMLEKQKEFQERLGYDFAAMSTVERVKFVKEMYIALQSEMTEALDEVSWKPWSKAEPKFMVLPFIGELTDVWCFFMNLWLVAMPNATPEQIRDAMVISYDTKMGINNRRQSDGYSGENKCVGCKRALDDPHTRCYSAHGDLPHYCAVNKKFYDLDGVELPAGFVAAHTS